MKAVCKYFEEHHEQYGAALFIVPTTLCAFAVIGIGQFLAWLL